MGELPKGWIQTSLGELCSKLTDGSHNPPKAKDSGLPMLSAKNIQNGKLHFELGSRLITEEEFISEDKRTRISKGDVLLTIVGALGRVAVVSTTEKFTLQRSVAVLSVPQISPNFLKYAIESPAFQKQILENAKGTAQKGIYLKKLRELGVVLPPLAEQTRIVEKLDEVLAQVDTIKARLDGIPALLKRFRQSVLASAVSGKLTEEWRASNEHNNWKKSTLGELVKIDRGSSPRPIKQYITDEPEGVNWVKIGDATKGGKYILQTEQKITKEGALKSRKVIPGDFILSNSMSLGLPYIMGIEGYVHDGWFVLRLPDNLDTEFFYYLLSSNELKSQFTNLAVGGVVKNIRSELVKEAKVQLPTLSEQKEIVRLVDQYFAFADTIEAQVKKAQARVDNLTQSILAKAFRGELVPQDPNDEPADKLLERIAEARKEAEALAKTAKKAQSTKSTAKKKVAKSA
ncbi:restriction endonuclease subunit S [Vibrio vulnificus]|nr:restriction endonuclease subunit S [Vibrio vulnificus]EKO5194483.1 restriction endonuclease subunit S [Vibrio vulnificus]